MNFDHSQTAQIEERLKTSARKLHQMAPAMGAAKQVKAYDSDRRKNLLARSMIEFLKNGESAVYAETHARASTGYEIELAKLAGDLANAEQTIAAYDAEYASWESARSLLSFAKETLNL